MTEATDTERLQRRLDVVEAILDIDPLTYARCKGKPDECGESCTDKSCPLQNNQVHRLGSIIVTLIEEFRWHRAWAAEMEHLRVVPEGTHDRVALRVRQSQLRDVLLESEDSLSDARGVPSLHKKLSKRIVDIRAEIQRLQGEITE